MRELCSSGESIELCFVLTIDIIHFVYTNSSRCRRPSLIVIQSI